jgi:hypothetical protein
MGKCANKDPVTRVEVRPSAGIDLPAGYGSNIPQSEEPSNLPGATDISTPTTLLPGGIQTQTASTIFSPGGKPADQRYKVWQIMLIALIPLFLVIVLSCLLA